MVNLPIISADGFKNVKKNFYHFERLSFPSGLIKSYLGFIEMDTGDDNTKLKEWIDGKIKTAFQPKIISDDYKCSVLFSMDASHIDFGELDNAVAYTKSKQIHMGLD